MGAAAGALDLSCSCDQPKYIAHTRKTAAAIPRNTFLLPAFSDLSGRLAPPNVKVGAFAALDSAGFESAEFVFAGLVSAVFSAALSDEILSGERAALPGPGADTSTAGGAASRAGAGALAAPLAEADDPELIAVLSMDGDFIEDAAGSADFTVDCIPALSVAVLADAVLAAAAIVV